MKKRKQTQQSAFTLIEILLVVSIIGILAGAGLPALGKALKIYRFKANANQVQAFLYEARHAAISKREASENPQSVDTNFDGDNTDLTPFAYVFEISHGVASAPVTLRTYADFDLDSATSNIYSSANPLGTDVLLDQKIFNASQLQITYTGRYDFTSTTTISEFPANKTYSFSYATEDLALTMTEFATFTPEEIDLITIQMTNPDATKTNTINLFHLSGAPFVSQ